ncbi:MAG: DUF4910 domain-containing protein [Methanobacteriota archaeon]|nr:MAG: DUF4910 domain-containing protein [Euryarchaeota archaeon]
MELGDLVKGELSGSSAKSYVAGLTRYHRIQASPMMRDAAHHVRDELLRIGIGDVVVEEYPADGRRKYWTHKSSMGWNARSAELHMLEPKRHLLANFANTPQSLHTFSAATPGKGVTAELVDVGKGISEEDYAKKRVRGKMVLATGPAKLVQREAVIKRGAAGVLTDTLAYEFPGVRESIDIPDAHSYQGLWPDAETAPKLRFGFSLSRRQGNELRKYLHDGKTVRLNAKVDADLKKGRYCVVTALIRGTARQEEEVFMVAHLCHPKPSANDNASGSGLLIEVARTITALVESGRIPRPKRSIRFLWVPETIGTVIYLSQHPGSVDRLVAGVNLDMVGEDQDVCKSTLCMECTPDSTPSYLNDLVYSNMVRSNAEYDNAAKIGIPSRYRQARTTFSGGSDHAEFNESTAGVPCVTLAQWPDMFYHTSMDTMDKVSEDSLRRVGWAVAVSVLSLADADTEAVHRLACKTASEGMARISQAVGDASEALHAAKREGRTAEFSRTAVYHKSRIEHVVAREVAAVRSLRRLDEEAGSDEFVEHQAAAVRDHGSEELTRFAETAKAVNDGKALASGGRGKRMSEAEREMRGIVPRKRFKGTLHADTLSELLDERDAAWLKEAESNDRGFSIKMYELLSLSDGRRDLREIAEFVSAEFGPTNHRNVLRYVKCLRDANLVTY